MRGSSAKNRPGEEVAYVGNFLGKELAIAFGVATVGWIEAAPYLHVGDHFCRPKGSASGTSTSRS